MMDHKVIQLGMWLWTVVVIYLRGLNPAWTQSASIMGYMLSIISRFKGFITPFGLYFNYLLIKLPAETMREFDRNKEALSFSFSVPSGLIYPRTLNYLRTKMIQILFHLLKFPQNSNMKQPITSEQIATQMIKNEVVFSMQEAKELQ